MAEAVVDLDAIAHNVRVFADAAAGAGVMAVVKADGFGHGAVQVAATALRNGATWLGVTSVTEALALREAGLDAPILLWLYPPAETFDAALGAGIDVSVSAVAALQALADAAQRAGAVANVHLKMDTGMSRGGAPTDEWEQLLRWAAKFERGGLLRVRGLWSHLAQAEDPDDLGLHRQLREFRRAGQAAESAGIKPSVVHLANSAAALHLPRTRFDLIRAGIGLYGVEPAPDRPAGLRPAMTVRARVVLTKRVPAGTGVSYGPDYVTSRETTLALVPLGFADGVPRGAAGRASFWVRGQRRPVAGRISMDQVVLDVGELPVSPGDWAVMFGPGDDGEPTVAEWADWAGTNPHEILTGIGPRVPRRYPGT
jgi:alanine racemase